MSWWIKDHIAVNSDESKQLCSIEADTQASLPPADQTATAGFIIVRGSDAKDISTGDKYIMDSSGSWMKQPSGVQLDLSGYATTQELTDGLASKVETSTYTAGQAAQDTVIAGKVSISTYNVGQAEQNAAIDVLANGGAKNLLRNTIAQGSTEIRTVQFTVNADGSVDIAAGTVMGGNADLSINASVSGLVEGASYILTGCPVGGSSTGYRLNVSGVGADTGSGLKFVYEGTPINVYIRISNGYTITDSITFKPMIRRAEIKDDSFVPYAPTNRELYEMILALQ
jgi:hypothetical protein